MLGKIEGKRRRGQPKVRQLDAMWMDAMSWVDPYSMDVSLSKL